MGSKVTSLYLFFFSSTFFLLFLKIFLHFHSLFSYSFFLEWEGEEREKV